MKTLKLFRLLSMIAALVFMLVGFMPREINEPYDWVMIAVLVVFLIIIPVNLAYYTKHEKSPKYLAEAEKGYMIMSIVIFGIMLIISIAGICTDFTGFCSSPWGYLMFIFVSLYQIFNHIIFYKAKKAYDSEN